MKTTAKFLTVGVLCSLFWLVPPCSASSMQSMYSDISEKACVVTERSTEGDGAVQRCPGTLGFAIQILTDDDRDSIVLIKDGHFQPLNFFGHEVITFNHLGDKAEWRVRDGKPVALIVRMSFTDPLTQVKEQRLFVSKVMDAGSCVTDVINATAKPNANLSARHAADHSAEHPCLWTNSD